MGRDRVVSKRKEGLMLDMAQLVTQGGFAVGMLVLWLWNRDLQEQVKHLTARVEKLSDRQIENRSALRRANLLKTDLKESDLR